jgi:ATP synthase protein I
LVTIVKTLPPAQPYEDYKDGDDEGDQKGHQTSKEPVFRRWSHADAAQLRKTNPVISPWQVVLWMVMTSVVVGVIGLIAFDTPTALSGAYGSLAVALPAALLARGMTSPLSSMNAVSSALAFMLWEMVKIGLSIGMLMLAPSLIANLSWPALLAGLILAMQMYFVAAVVKPKPSGVVRRSKSAE